MYVEARGECQVSSSFTCLPYFLSHWTWSLPVLGWLASESLGVSCATATVLRWDTTVSDGGASRLNLGPRAWHRSLYLSRLPAPQKQISASFSWISVVKVWFGLTLSCFENWSQFLVQTGLKLSTPASASTWCYRCAHTRLVFAFFFSKGANKQWEVSTLESENEAGRLWACLN